MKKLKMIFIKLKNFIKQKQYNIMYYYKCYEKLKIDEKAILLCAKQGKNIDGNIFYILKELQKDIYKDYKIYVACEKDKKLEFIEKFTTYNFTNYELISITSKKYFKALATSKYLFNDTSFMWYFVKKEGQIYLNTWHGTPFKAMGRSDKDGNINIGNSQKNFLACDYLLYPSKYMMDIMLDDYMIRDLIGKTHILLSGYPRNEIFFDKERAKKLKQELHLEGKEIIAYMPTWRGSNVDNINLDTNIAVINNHLKEIDKKLKNNQVFFVNFHPFIQDKINISGYKHIKPFDKKYETYDFLNMADILITDYSSVFFDFAITNKKIILFAYDKKDYFKNRGTYFDINDLPFTKVYNVKDLIKEINNKKSKQDIKNFLDKYCYYETYDASKKICDLIFNNDTKNIEIKSYEKSKENVLIFTGNLSQNGITTSLNSLLNNISLDDKNYYLAYVPSHIKGNEDFIKNLNKKVKYIAIKSNFVGTFKETLLNVLEKLNIISYKKLDRVYDKFYKREILRQFGMSTFDTTIQFCGYGGAIIKLFSKFDSNKVIYAHSDMVEEAKIRHNQNKKLLKFYYDKYDKVVVVNETIYDSMSTLVDKNKLYIVENIIDYEEIIRKSNLDICFDNETKSTIAVKDLKKILNDKNKIKFINVGRFSKEKGQQRLMEAFDMVYKQNKNCYLIIIGGHGNLYQKLLKYKEKLESKNNIILIKHLKNPFSIIKKCNCFVMSSFYEGFGLALAEADILNLKVFSTDIKGPRTFIMQNNGNLVPNTMNGIYEGMMKYLSNNLNDMHVDYKKYNENAIKEFYAIFNKEGKMCMEKNVKREQINKQDKSIYKKLFYVLLILNVIMVALAGSLSYIYVNRQNFRNYKLYIELKKYKDKFTEIIKDNDIFSYEENKHNASFKLNLPSAYDDNQPTHPKILYFKDGWNGYKYWLTYSPYPYGNDKYENPHILVSNDLVNFKEPDGFENPLVDTPEEFIHEKIYNSDPHLVYNDDNDTLEIYYRFVDNTKDEVIIYRKTTKDGINWTDSEEILKEKRSKKDYVSPAIIYDDHMYKMWYVDKNTVMYEESQDGKTYTNKREIKIRYNNSSLKTWHLDVIKTDIGYEMITVAFSKWEGRANMNLYYTKSSDNEKYELAYPIIKPSNISWDNGGLYRSSFIKIKDMYYVYYSAMSKENEKGIGLSYGNNIYDLKGLNTTSIKNS